MVWRELACERAGTIHELVYTMLGTTFAGKVCAQGMCTRCAHKVDNISGHKVDNSSGHKVAQGVGPIEES